MKGATSRASVEHPCMIHLLPSLRVLLVRQGVVGLRCLLNKSCCLGHCWFFV